MNTVNAAGGTSLASWQRPDWQRPDWQRPDRQSRAREGSARQGSPRNGFSWGRRWSDRAEADGGQPRDPAGLGLPPHRAEPAAAFIAQVLGARLERPVLDDAGAALRAGAGYEAAAPQGAAMPRGSLIRREV